MFGGSNRKNNNDSLSKAMMPENAPKKSGGGGSVTGFDPEGLERAAKAARELDASRNASSAIELIKTQEVTKQVRKCYPEKQTIGDGASLEEKVGYAIVSCMRVEGKGTERRNGQRVDQKESRNPCYMISLTIINFVTHSVFSLSC